MRLIPLAGLSVLHEHRRWVDLYSMVPDASYCAFGLKTKAIHCGSRKCFTNRFFWRNSSKWATSLSRQESSNTYIRPVAQFSLPILQYPPIRPTTFKHSIPDHTPQKQNPNNRRQHKQQSKKRYSIATGKKQNSATTSKNLTIQRQAKTYPVELRYCLP